MTVTAGILSFCVNEAFAETADFSHYQPILERHPFGAPPAPPPTNTVVSATDVTEEEVIEDPYIIPPGLDQIQVSLISRYNGIPAAGFIDGETRKPYYLLEGQEFDDFKLIQVDMKAATITLQRGTYEAELPLWINPATTNQADVATFGLPAGSAPTIPCGPAVAAKKTFSFSHSFSSAQTPEEQARIDDFKRRREEARARRDAQRKAHAEEMAKLTPEQREQRLRDINLDIIINNGGPPLPIELNANDMKKLSEAGFAVPGMPE